MNFINKQGISGVILKSASEKFTGREMKNLLSTYKLKVDQSEADCKKASDLLSAFETVRGGSVSVAVKSENDQDLPTRSIESFRMGFPSESKNGHQADLLTTFSYLVLTSAFGDQLKDLLRVEPATDKRSGKMTNAKLMSGPTVKGSKTQPIEKSQHDKKTFKTKENPPPKSSGAHAKPENPDKPYQSKPQQSKPQQYKPRPSNPQQTSFPMSSKHRAMHRSHENLSSHALTVAPLPAHLLTIPPPMLPVLTGPSMDLKDKKVWVTFALNGQTYGRVAFEPRPDVAPIMCHKFAQTCTNKGSSYVGSIVYQAS